MFKNPLNKYAAGGVAASQEQRAEESFINAIAQQLQQEPEQVRARYEEIKSNPDEMQELQNAVQTMQKDKKKGVQMIVALFQKQAPQQGSVMSAEQGDKIQNFVSKHAKGGALKGGGCKEEGGNIEKAQRGLKAITPGFRYLGEYSVQDKFNPRINHVAGHGYEVNGEDIAVPTKQGGHGSGMDYDSVYNNEGEKTMSRSMFDNLKDFYTRALPESNQVKTLDQEKLIGMENGGKVLQGQRGLSSGRFDIPFGAYMKAYFNKRSTPNVGAATNRSFGYSTSNGNEYYLEDANIGRNSVDTGVNVTPQKDTIIMQKLPSDHINDLEDYQMEAIMQRMRPDIKRVNSKEIGGKVEKAQSGGNVNILGKITPYTNPVSTTPMDSSEVVYNPLFRSLVFKDINGNDVSWARNYDGSYRYRNGKDIMDFDPNQDAGYIPYGKMKAWGRGTSGSTKLSETDNENLKNLEDKTRLKKKKNLK